MSVRDEVLEHIVEFMRAAEEQGSDPIKAAAAAFPGTPQSVLGQADWILEERRTEAWWQAIEKTIDGEVIKLALEKGAPRGGPQ